MKRAILLMTLLAMAGCGSANSTAATGGTSVGTFTVTDLVVGTGATVVNGTKATVTYTGWLYDTGKANGKGNQFDTGSFSFVVGAGAVVKGFDQALVGMKVGGQRRVIIPPELAYGATSPSAAIPANATLVFEITLTSVS